MSAADDNIVDDLLLADLDEIRFIPGSLGLCPFQATVRRRTWTGPPHLPSSTYSDEDTLLVNTSLEGAVTAAHVKQVSRQDVFASGGQLQAGDWKVGPMTPDFAATLVSGPGGVGDEVLDPRPLGAPSANVVQLIWIIKTTDGRSHGIPTPGIVCEKKGETTGAMNYYVILRSTGRSPT